MNVATHLLADVFRGEVEAAIVVSNDSDLALPLTIARTLDPVGTVNPGTNPLAVPCFMSVPSALDPAICCAIRGSA